MKPTFEKLSIEKKTTFLTCAFQEFASCDYAQANIGRIAISANIAKGSIYQYFKDKKDLYFYLIQQAQQKKQQAISHIFQEKPFQEKNKKFNNVNSYVDNFLVY